jgi:hypothetical protein
VLHHAVAVEGAVLQHRLLAQVHLHCHQLPQALLLAHLMVLSCRCYLQRQDAVCCHLLLFLPLWCQSALLLLEDLHADSDVEQGQHAGW